MIKGDDAEESGIHTLPLIFSMVIFSVVAGITTWAIGYYSVCLLLGAVWTPIGAGLLMMLKVNSNAGPWYVTLFEMTNVDLD